MSYPTTLLNLMKNHSRASLVAQWLRIHLPMQNRLVVAEGEQGGGRMD